MASTRSAPSGSPRVLLVGYNGANNTGAEALLLADIADLREVFGGQAHLTVPTLNERNLRRYLKEAPDLSIEPIPSIYFGALRRLVAASDIVLLVEGSSYMDTWSPALLWAFLWATRCARAAGRPCMAYAVDAGEMKSALNRRLVRTEASRTDLVVTRAEAAARRLRSWGVTAPIEVTADNAFRFRPEPADADLLGRVWPGARRVAGIAAVDFALWPVVARLWGRREHCYRWPYYFSRSRERCRRSEELARGYAGLADRLVERAGLDVALICMEQLDEPLARRIEELMQHRRHARVFSSREYNASQMTVLLRSLELLLTSRYHACVLSLAAAVPQVAVGHDLRLRTIYQDIGIGDWFVEPTLPEMFEQLGERVERLIAAPGRQRKALARGHAEHLARARRNPELLRRFARSKGWPAGR